MIDRLNKWLANLYWRNVMRPACWCWFGRNWWFHIAWVIRKRVNWPKVPPDTGLSFPTWRV